jgi:hypothetical protein
MSGNRIPLGFLSPSQIQGAIRRDDVPRRAVVTRLTARLLAAKFDRMLAVGVPAPAGSALAVHAQRLASVEEREAVAKTLRRSVNDAHNPGARLSSRVPLNVANIVAAEERIDQITLRLHSPRPVTARGVARLRVLLSDGAGPMYRHGRGDLEGRLGAAFAAL